MPREGLSIRALIVDDEPLARDCVRLALAREEGFQVVGECGDGRSTVEAILALNPDLVFLDVQMPGENGFDVIARVGPARMPPVVFVTAYDEHAVRAFEVHALDYILKPFDDARFREVMDHVRRRLAAEEREGAGATLAALLRDQPGERSRFARRITVETDNRIRFLLVEEIDFLESEGNYVRIHHGTETHRIRSSLTGLTEQLDPARFIRIHRSTTVNVDRIKEVQPWFGGDYLAILRDGTQLRVSRRYRASLLRLTH
jgi:two-component system LytT family response regulator